MSMPAFVELLRRRWWLIVIVAALALGGAGAYALRERHVYESTATLYVHPTQAFLRQSSPAVISSELGVLSYGSLVNTFLSIAQSRSMLRDAASTLYIPPDRLKRYTAVATERPKSFVLDISVDGPDPKLVVALANNLSQRVGGAVSAGFPVVALSSLGAASTSTQIRPRVKRDLAYGGLAGLIVGFVLAGPSVSPAPKPGVRDGEDDSHSAGEGNLGGGPMGEQRVDAELPAARTV